MSGATPYGHVQPDPLAFLDQPIGAFGTVATTVPPSLLAGETSASNDSAAQHLQPPAWILPPRLQVRLASLVRPKYMFYLMTSGKPVAHGRCG